MTILSGDIALLASQVMDDVSEGGGSPTAVVIHDGTSNGIFADISELDRAGGRVSMRKIFPSVRTDNTDGFFGANIIVAEPPADPRISVSLFSTGDMFDTRTSAKSRIESYLSKAQALAGYLFGDHIGGQQTITVLQDVDTPLPVVGDTFCLTMREGSTNTYEQFVRVTDVTSRIRTFADSEGVYKKAEVLMTISDALTSDYIGFEASRRGPDKTAYLTATKIYSTIVADAARYYGTALLTSAVSVGDSVINASTIFTQLVPSAKIEVPIVDSRMNQRKTTLAQSGSDITETRTTVFSSANQLYIGGKILPGSLRVTQGPVTLKDAGGTLKNGTVSMGTVDYDNGILSLSSDVFGTGATQINYTYTPASSTEKVTMSVGIPVTKAGQRLNYVMSIDAVPAAGSVSVSYRALDHWYVLTDDGTGALRGFDSSVGAGQVNYATGSVAATLGVLPDVGSELIVQWVSNGDTSIAELVPTGAMATEKRFSRVVELATAMKPGTVHLTWAVGGVNKSSVDLDGKLTGDAAGQVDYATGRVEFSPNILPPADTVITLSNTETVAVQGDVAGMTDGGDYWTIALPGAVTPATLMLAVYCMVGDLDVYIGDSAMHGYKTGAILTDDGNGHIRTPSINSTAFVTVGSINYSTGIVTLSKITTGYEILGLSIAPTKIGDIQSTDGTSSVTTYTPLGYKTVSVPIAIVANPENFNNFKTPWWTTSDICVAKYSYSGSTGSAATITFPFNKLFLQSDYVPDGFILNGKRHMVKADATIVKDISPSTGVGTTCGTMGIVGKRYGMVLTTWDANTSPVVSNILGVRTVGTSSLVDAITFRTAIAPLFNGGFTLNGTLQDDTTFSVTPNADGNIINDALGIYGTVRYTTGVATLRFGVKVPDTSATLPGVIDLSYLGIAGLKYVAAKFAKADSFRYNAVGYSYLPLDQNILGLNPVRLPSDGRVPIFRAGSFAVVGHTHTSGPVIVSNGQVYNAGRVRLSRVKVTDKNNVLITTGLTADLEAGTVTFSDVSGYEQPISIENRVEDMALIRSVNIDGTIALTRPLTHDYPVSGTTVSSALVLGDLRARVSITFDQGTWTNVWSDSPIGSDAVATYNNVLAPILVTNKGALTERWAVVFQSSSTFNVIGEHVGIIATGSINADCSPLNPSGGVPYFTLKALGWGLGWEVGNVLRFNTIGASPPVWVVRTILQGAASVASDQFTLLVRGDIDNPN
ncbi:hypothetical protein KDM87_14345 [Undibacterium sp. FT147W]|uniref:Uncharacterized protein n=1 Tax=Undibacterium rivi TaxID=2828729 RepID=A0ABS5H4G0_9BURK|nr:hypothetical protein [Undibacterium rivi]MBR7793776.1 hypothetical protein [Undibacterium rivi]